MKTAMSWYHLGLRGRLFMAFGVVAALTVLASSSAIISYDSLGHSLGEIADKSLPLITKIVPSTKEKLPVIGIGTNNFGVSAPEEM